MEFAGQPPFACWIGANIRDRKDIITNSQGPRAWDQHFKNVNGMVNRKTVGTICFIFFCRVMPHCLTGFDLAKLDSNRKILN